MTTITNYKNVNDWFYLITGTILVDFIALVFTKYPGKEPYFNVNILNDWYTKFGLLAVVSDVSSILIGIAITRYIYTMLKLNNPIFFIVILLLFQLFHDIFFFLVVVTPLPKGENQMIDVFKKYANENGKKILGADALLMLGSITAAYILKSFPSHVTSLTLLVTVYAFCYILYTKNASKDRKNNVD